ncbi:MAG: hypothetical protein M1147_07390 [Nitrospirae bacterium]|nr:hypothetical protein [Nitrospirota bacterium]MCL5977935.1 hypothetical protein [Nitrospirota bacterium]
MATKGKREEKSSFNFKRAIEQDNTLVLELLYSPIKTLKERDVICDQTMINNFEKVREDVLKRAKAAFIELGLVRTATQGCQGCQGCSAEIATM